MPLSADVQKAIDRALDEFGAELVPRFRREVDALGITNTGELRKSFDHAVVRSGSRPALQITAAEHWEYVDQGTYPFWPPQAPIQRWVERKLRIPFPESRRVAFLVRRKIAREGIDPRFFVERVMSRALPALQFRLGAEIEEALTIEVGR